MGSSVQPECLFCRIYREGDHVRSAEGFVAVRDINPRAETHLLVIPERHVDTFRDIGEFSGDETKGMLEFVANTAHDAGLETIGSSSTSASAPARRSSTCTGT